MALPIEVVLPKDQYWYSGDGPGRNSIKFVMLDQTNNPVDLTPFGSVWAAQLQDKFSKTRRVNLMVDASNKENGEIIIKADPTVLLSSGSFQFDVQASGGSISPLTIWRGFIEVVEDVTE